MVIIEIMKTVFILIFSILIYATEVEIEILGSGGPELDGSASTSYLLWIDGEAKVLIDVGSGSMLRFEEAKARIETLEAILLTHLHIDHAVDLPSYMKAGFFSKRTKELPVIGPEGNLFFPSTVEYCTILFGQEGAYRYMQDILTPQSDSFQIIPKDINNTAHLEFKSFTVDVIPVHHGPVPALAYRITVGKKSLVISGDTNNETHTLENFTKDADLFIAHHAIPESVGGVAKALHMSPSVIASVATKSGVKKIVLTHRMVRTLEHENETLIIMRKTYDGQIVFAKDHMRIRL